MPFILYLATISGSVAANVETAGISWINVIGKVRSRRKENKKKNGSGGTRLGFGSVLLLPCDL